MDTPRSPSEEALERVRSSIATEEVNAQLERVCRSDTFDGQGYSQSILRFLVKQALERSFVSAQDVGRGPLEKEYFEPGIDSDVRVAMKKFREKLNEYYEKEAKDDEIWFYSPEKQYNIYWKHSPKTRLGRSEFTEWILFSPTLTREEAQRAADTSRKFWPHLASVFPVYCTQDFDTIIDRGEIALPNTVKMFFHSIGNYHVFITSLNRSEIRIYPLNVWLDEWARAKVSEISATNIDTLKVYEHWGKSGEIENRAEISIHPKLLNVLNLPADEGFAIKLSFHPAGFIYFDVPPPLPRPVGKYRLYHLSYTAEDGQPLYYYLMVAIDKVQELEAALAGTATFNIKAFGTVLAAGYGEPAPGLKEQLLTKYSAVVEKDSPA